MPYIIDEPGGRRMHVALHEGIIAEVLRKREPAPPMPLTLYANPTMPPEHVLQALCEPRRLQRRELKRRQGDRLWFLG
jgi:hypothetical protein